MSSTNWAEPRIRGGVRITHITGPTHQASESVALGEAENSLLQQVLSRRLFGNVPVWPGSGSEVRPTGEAHPSAKCVSSLGLLKDRVVTHLMGLLQGVFRNSTASFPQRCSWGPVGPVLQARGSSSNRQASLLPWAHGQQILKGESGLTKERSRWKRDLTGPSPP